MLDYKTAKQLKDAGFEVPVIGEQWFKDRKDGKFKLSGAVNIIENGEEVEVPTLEDMIEFVDGKEMIENYEQLYASLALRKLNNVRQGRPENQ